MTIIRRRPTHPAVPLPGLWLMVVVVAVMVAMQPRVRKELEEEVRRRVLTSGSSLYESARFEQSACENACMGKSASMIHWG